MANFSSTVELGIEVPESELRSARSAIEGGLGGVSVATDGGGPAARATGGGSDRQGRRMFRWARQRTTYLETMVGQLDTIEDKVGGGGGGGGGSLIGGFGIGSVASGVVGGLAGTLTVSAASVLAVSGTLGLAAASVLAVTGTIDMNVTDIITTAGVLTLGIASIVAVTGTLGLSAAAVLAVTGTVGLAAASVLAVTGALALNASNILSVTGVLTIGAAAALAITGTLSLPAAATIAVVGTVAVAAGEVIELLSSDTGPQVIPDDSTRAPTSFTPPGAVDMDLPQGGPVTQETVEQLQQININQGSLQVDVNTNQDDAVDKAVKKARDERERELEQLDRRLKSAIGGGP